MKNIKKLLGLFVFICIFMFSATNVDALNVVNGLVEVSTFEEFAKYAQREDTEEEKVTEIKLVNDITISGYVGIGVEDGLTIDLNGKKLDINESLVVIMYGANNDGTTFYDSATLTFKDSSREKIGVVDNIQTFIIFNAGKDTFNFMEPNEASQDYKLIIDGGTFRQTSILNNGGVTYDSMFSLMEATNEAWHDNVKFTFEVNDGNFEACNNNELATSALFGGVIEYGESNENPNLDINLNLKKLRFRSKNGQLVKNYNYDFDYTINDVISNSSKLYIGNTTLNKEMEITDRTISAVGSIPTSVYSNLMESYEYMEIEEVKYDLTTNVDGTGGTISDSENNILLNTKKTITFTPNTGFMIDKVLVNNVETQVTNNNLELTINEDKNVVVTYKKIPFTITVKETNNATITPNGIINVNYGDNQDFVINADYGYKIVKILVDGNNTDLNDNKLTLSNITKNLEVEVFVEPIVYNFLEGLSQTYTVSKDKELRFRIDADYSLFNNLVYIDGELIDRNNYTSESGSTIIILKQSYLDTLKVGEHTFKVKFSDGAEVETKFVVAQLEKQEENPKTVDNILFYVATSIISLTGLGTIGVYTYRKK